MSKSKPVAVADAYLLTLGRFFLAAIDVCEGVINAMPDHIDPREECELINAASASAYALAEIIRGIDANGAAGRKLRKQAAAWIKGTYWAESKQEVAS